MPKARLPAGPAADLGGVGQSACSGADGWRPACLQAELREKLGAMYSVSDSQNVFVFGFRTQVQAGAHLARTAAAGRH